MREHKNFWDRNAGRYDRFMRKDRAAYEKMYGLIRPVVKGKTVLELAAGTGLIAKNIVNAAAHIEASDTSAEMIREAKRRNHSAKLHFSVQNMFCLPYADGAFDIVLSLNGFHAFPDKEAAYREVFRVLKPGGTFCGCFYVAGECKQSDWFVRHVYEKTGFFTPPYETISSLKARLEGMYTDVDRENLKSMAWFVCRKAKKQARSCPLSESELSL